MTGMPPKCLDPFAEEIVFRCGNKPRKWREWRLTSIRERMREYTSIFEELIKLLRKAGTSDEEFSFIAKLCEHFKLLKTEPLEIQELFVFIYFRYFDTQGVRDKNPHWFSDGLINFRLFDGDVLSRQIAVHNLLLTKTFSSLGLNWEQWVNYSPVNASIKIKTNPSSRWQQLDEELLLLEHALDKSHPLRPSILKDCMALRKKKAEVMRGQLSEVLLEELFPTLFKGIEYLTRKPGSGKKIKVARGFMDRLYLIQSMVKEFFVFGVRNFRIELWDRNDFQSLFLGNFLENCLSIGEKDVYPAVRLPGVPGKRRPAGVLDYLVDKGIQVVKIIEKKDGQEYHVGHCYLFVFLDNQKPVLMIDSVEIHSSYRNRSLKREIRKALFEFLKGYARAVGIERVVLGNNGPTLRSGKNKGQRHKIQNGIDVFDLLPVSLEKIEKLGGYWNHQPYFLESVGGTEAYVIV